MNENKELILLIEDEPQMRRFLRITLQTQGYRLVESETGSDGLLQAAARNPDVVLLDLRLPGVSGIEMLMTMREFVPGVEIILLTGHLDLAQRIQGMRLDAFEYIMKPIEIADLINKIKKAGKHRDRT